MARYIENALMSGERIVYEAKPSLWSFSGLILVGILLTPVAIGLFFFLAVWIRYASTELAITNKRVIAKFGFISRRTVELSMQRIEGVEVSQSILGRMLNYGSLVISGSGSMKEPISGISDPLRFRREFAQAHEAAIAS